MKYLLVLFLTLSVSALGIAQSTSGSGTGTGTGDGTTSTSKSGAVANITMNNAAATPTIQALPGVMGGPLFPALTTPNGQWNGYRPAANYAVTEAAAKLMAGHKNHHCMVNQMAVSDVASNNEAMTMIGWWPDYVQGDPHDQILATVDCETTKFREPMQAALGSALVACKRATNTNRVAVRFRDLITGVTSGFSIGGSGAVSPFTEGNPTAYAAGGFIGKDRAYTQDHYEVQVYCMNKGPYVLPPPSEKPGTPAEDSNQKPTPTPQAQTVKAKVVETTAPPEPFRKTTPTAAAPPVAECGSMPPFNALFDFSKANVQNADLLKIKEYAAWIVAHASCSIAVEGFTDKVGTNDYNAALGMQRSDAVYQLLIAAGVPRQQLKKLSGGKASPAGDWDAGNRRVVLQILGPASGK